MFYNRCTSTYKFGNNIYPRRIRRRSNWRHIFRKKKYILWAGKYGTSYGIVFFHCGVDSSLACLSVYFSFTLYKPTVCSHIHNSISWISSYRPYFNISILVYSPIYAYLPLGVNLLQLCPVDISISMNSLASRIYWSLHHLRPLIQKLYWHSVKS